MSLNPTRQAASQLVGRDSVIQQSSCFYYYSCQYAGLQSSGAQPCSLRFCGVLFRGVSVVSGVWLACWLPLWLVCWLVVNPCLLVRTAVMCRIYHYLSPMHPFGMSLGYRLQSCRHSGACASACVPASKQAVSSHAGVHAGLP